MCEPTNECPHSDLIYGDKRVLRDNEVAYLRGETPHWDKYRRHCIQSLTEEQRTLLADLLESARTFDELTFAIYHYENYVPRGMPVPREED